MQVILTARHRDLVVRAITSYDVAIERARDLIRLGWEVELEDDAGNPVAWR
jgi:hypothetical protein